MLSVNYRSGFASKGFLGSVQGSNESPAVFFMFDIVNALLYLWQHAAGSELVLGNVLSGFLN